MNSLHWYASSRFQNLPKTFALHNGVVPWWNQILDPQSDIVIKWNHFLFVTCLIALFLDPLYFYLPLINNEDSCMTIDVGLGVVVTFFRTVADILFFMHLILKFRIAFIAPSSRVFGRGELVMDSKAIAKRYLRSDFLLDLAAALPLPQIVIWFVIPAAISATADFANHSISLIVLIQYVPRIFIMFPLNRRIMKTAGSLAKTAWSGSAYTLLIYLLASHVLGASWYLFSIQRQYDCWKMECAKEMNATHSPSCEPVFLECLGSGYPDRVAWLKRTRVFSNCDAKIKDKFQFGIFTDAFTNNVVTTYFNKKYFYCLWWGLKALSSYGQNLETTTFAAETLFSILICISGLVLFSYLIGKMQTYVESTNSRLEEWRIRRRDTEEWMRHRQLPEELRERVRRFLQYKWLATRGVDEESILQSLPLDLRRQIQRHLCLAYVRRVPLFAQMDQQLLDAICERLYSSLNTKETYLIREGDPVNEMLFIIRGQVESSTTNGGRTGFFNSITLKTGDFCGEELLTWALMTTSTLNLPLSTRTVKSITEVEAFALQAEDLKFVASQFKHLHSKKLQHAFRYYSHQWRAWGACFIQAAWRRFIRKKAAMLLAIEEGLYATEEENYPINETSGERNEDISAESSAVENANNARSPGSSVLSSKLNASTRRALSLRLARFDTEDSSLKMPKLLKPQDPDFCTDHQ